MPTRLCDIKPGDSDLTIRVRICRLWRGKMLMDAERNDGLQCVLVDRNNNAIHATVSEADYEEVSERIKLGLIYEITNFHASDNQTTYIVVPHRAQLMFNNRINFRQLNEVYPPYPKYWFEFPDFSDLFDRIGKDKYLSDVIGRIDTIYEVEDVYLSGRMAPKRSIEIVNLGGRKLTVNLWGTMGIEFDVDAVKRELYPVVAVFTSTKVRTFGGDVNVSSGMSTCIFFNPSIPETEEYKRNFIGPAYAPKFVAGPGTKKQRLPVDISAVDIMSIYSLNKKRTPAGKPRDISFFIKGEITKIMCQQQWHYMGCPKCLKQVRTSDGSSSPRCLTHQNETGQPMYKLQVRVEDKTDSVTIMAIGRGGEFLFGIPCEKLLQEQDEGDRHSPPPELMKLMGETRIFEVTYGSRNDFIIKSVHHDSSKSKANSSTSAAPEKLLSKRTLKIRNETSADDFSQQEPSKKKKSEQANKSTEKQAITAHDQDKEISEEDEDFTLSQLFKQQLSYKKNSGQGGKALVIGKKSSQQTSKTTVGEEKRSERIRQKNKSKME